MFGSFDIRISHLFQVSRFVFRILASKIYLALCLEQLRGKDKFTVVRFQGTLDKD